jgi:Phosphate-selective porin O and P
MFLLLFSVCTANASGQANINQTETLTNTNSFSKWFSETNILDNLKFQGFASQAFIATSDNNVFGKTDQGGGFGFTEIGLNALFRPTSRLQFSAQMLSRRAGEGGNAGEPRLDFGFVDYLLYSHETHQFGIRVGRLKNPFGFYNDTRDVAFTRPSILLPQSIYFDRTRNLGLSADSVQLYGETSHPTIGNFSVQLGVTRPLTKNRETEFAIFNTDKLPGEISPEASFIGRGIYETHDARFRFAISGIWLNTHYSPGVNDRLTRGSFSFSPLFLSAQYNAEKWSLTAEYALRRLDFKNFGVPALDVQADNTTGESFYVQGVYRFHPKWEALLRYDVFFADRNDRNGKEYVQWQQDNNLTPRPAHSRFARDLTVGLRWNITPQIMARFEYHYINGTGWLSGLDNSVSSATVKEWDLFAAQLSFRF